jgi:hypothetical protein
VLAMHSSEPDIHIKTPAISEPYVHSKRKEKKTTPRLDLEVNKEPQAL